MNEAALKAFLDKHKSAQRAQYDNDGILFYEFPKDTTRVLLQFFPPVHNSAIPGKFIYQHWVNSTQIKVIQCFKTHEMDCPMCAMLDQYRGRLDLEPWDFKVKSQTNVLILQDDSYLSRYKRPLDSKAPHVLSTNGYGTLNWLVEGMLDKMIGNFTDPERSFAWVFEREKRDGKFKRTMVPMQRTIGDSPEERAILLSKAVDFTKLYKTPDDVYLQKMRDAVALVKDVIENKLMTMASPEGQFQNMPNPAAPPMPPGPDDGYWASLGVSPQGLPTAPAQPMAPPMPTSHPVNPGAPVYMNPPVPQQQTYTVPGINPMPGVIPPQTQQHRVMPSPAPMAAPPVQMAPQQPMNAMPPQKAGAPECLGNKAIFDPNSEKCRLCVWDFHCQTAIQRTAV